MHYVRVMITHKTSPEGEQWVTHMFKQDELSELHTRIRDLEQRNKRWLRKLTNTIQKENGFN